jgi:DHA2 family lincomycin resistance protein-like MFS transporter
MGALGPSVGRIYDRIGARPLVIPGAVAMVTVLAAFGRLDADTSYAVLLGLHVALMASLAMVFTPVFTVGLGDLPAALYSHGSSLLGTLQQVAGAVGTAVLIVLLDSRSEHLVRSGTPSNEAFVGGLQWAFTAAAAMGTIVLAASLLLPRRTVPAPDPADRA